METAEILKAGADELIIETNDNTSTCSLTQSDAINEFKRQKVITQNTKDKLVESIEGAIGELNSIIQELSNQAKLGNNTKYINSMLYNSLVLLIDELDYIAKYIERIENSIDNACFDIAKKLNESIVNLIGHRKDIIFKVIETT